jgi:DNA replication and repair protein RecF
MLHLNSLKLTQFKNYSFAAFTFDKRITGICGLNGKGKTNLLDAIHYICFTKSYFSKTDTYNAQFGSDGFRLEADFALEELQKKEHDTVTCVYKGVNRKEITVNNVPYEKFSKHIGRYPAVMIAPDDVEMITGPGEERRKFMDTLLSQTDPEYLQQLIVYNKVLQQRNSLLKQFAEKGKTDNSLLEVLDEQLCVPAAIIHNKRKEFTRQLVPVARDFYKQIALNDEVIDITYESQLNDTSLSELLISVRQKDFALQRTNAGIHKDELQTLLNGSSFRTIASQGQRKSLLFALKLAEFTMIKNIKGFAPLLLLDDIFEKLDERRMQHLLHWVCNNSEGQVFITDTHRERLTQSLNKAGVEPQVIELK